MRRYFHWSAGTSLEQGITSAARWRYSIIRTVLMMITLAVVLSSVNLALDVKGFPWAPVLGVPLVAFLLESIMALVSSVRSGNSVAARREPSVDNDHEGRQQPPSGQS